MQVNRLFQIIYILIDKEVVTSKYLANRFEVSTRTIYRDIEVLSVAGIPVYMKKGRGGGIALLPNFVLDKAVLTGEEKENILASLKAMSAVEFDDESHALHKLSSMFGGSNWDWIEIDFSQWADVNNQKEVFNILKQATLSKNIVNFHYASGKGEQRERKVEPLKLCFKCGGWYLYGYCKMREDNRFFKLSRIKDLTVLDEIHKRTATSKIFSDENIFNEELITLKLKISPEKAYRVYDEFNIYKEQEDGSFIAEITYPKGDWIFPYIASFGESCEVIEPEEIRNEIKEKMQKILKYYL